MALCTGQASAQRWDAPAHEGDQGIVSVLIEPSAPIYNLFQHAEEGIARADWKFVIDSLQRIIDHPEGSLLPRPEGATTAGEVFESARRAASRRLSALPPEGLAAYRLLYDGKARALLQRARRDYDTTLLRSIVDRYLLTSSGDDAAVLFASWALDEGRPAEALAVLGDLVELAAAYDVPRRSIAVKMAAAYAQLEQYDEAATIASALAGGAEDLSPDNEASLLAEIENVVRQLPEADRSDTAMAGGTGDHASWPVGGGSPSRGARMAEVSPTIGRSMPWRVAPPGVEPASWRPTVSDDPHDPLVAPPGRLVASDGRLLARTPMGLAAYDIDTLDPIWALDHPAQVDPSGDGGASQILDMSPMWSEEVMDEAVVFEDRAAWSVSIAHGLALSFTRVSAAVTARTFIAGGMRMRMGDGGDGEGDTMLLTAHDAVTGEFRWERGVASDPSPLAGAQFRAAPIPVGDALWVPIQRQRDLYAAILNPRDGSLVRSVLLGTLPGRSAPAWQELQPAADHSTVYIPSGIGTIFAVDAHDYSLRWATKYAVSTIEQVASAWTAARMRLPSAPVVADGLVLLLPADRQRLFALSTASGELRWSTRLSETAYIVGVGDGRLWLGGRQLSCRSIRDGAELWRTDVEVASTGRAVLSGGLIYVPSWDGLASYDALTGAEAGFESLPTAEPALGNLLCIDNAMFSLDPGSIRRFPDVTRAYPGAVARYSEDRTDLSAAARLAWLEILRGAPDRALEVIGDLSAEPGDGGATLALANAQVEALLEVAQRAESANAALPFLESAVAAARGPKDRLRCGLALAERLSEAGKHAEAYRHLVQLGLSPAADGVTPVADYVEAPARFAVADLLERLGDRLEGIERTSLANELGERLGRAATTVQSCDPPRRSAECREAEAELLAAAQLGALGAPADRARLTMAGLRTEQQRFEEAEQFLFDVARRGANAPDRIAALMRLFDLHSDVWGTEARPGVGVLEELMTRYADAAVPGMPGETVRGWVESVRATNSSALGSRGAGSRDEATFALTGSPAWAPIILDLQRRPGIAGYIQDQQIPPALFDFGSSQWGAMSHRLVALGADEAVECYDVTNGENLWRAPLAAEETFDEHQVRWRRPDERARRRAWKDGETGVVATEDGLFAVGLVSGKRVWSRPYERGAFDTGESLHTVATAGGRGWLATTIRPGRLTAIRMLDGATIWQRDLRGESVDEIRVFDIGARGDSDAGFVEAADHDAVGEPSGDVIVTLDAKRQRAQIIGAADGRMISKLLFEQPDLQAERIDIVGTSGMLVGPRSDREADAVTGVALADGEQAWQLSLSQPLVRLFVPAEGYVGIGLLGGGVRIVDVHTGEVMFEKDIPGGQRVVDGLLVSGTLVLRYLEPSGADVAMEAFDLATGESLWDRHALAPLDAAVEPMRMAGGLIPTLLVQDQRVRGRHEYLSIVMVDPRTGEDVGQRADFMYGYGGEGTGVQIAVRSGAIVVGTMMGLFPFQTAQVTMSRGEDS